MPAVYFVDSDRNSFIMEAIVDSISAGQFIEDCRCKSNFQVRKCPQLLFSLFFKNFSKSFKF